MRGEYVLDVQFGLLEPHRIRSYDLIQGHIGTCIGVNTRNHKYSPGQRLKDEKRDITVTAINRRFIDNKGTLGKTVSYRCNVCGYENLDIRECAVTRGNGCPVCAGKIVVAEYNDIPTTAPWMVPFFYGGAAEAGQYTQNSGRTLRFQCPCCGTLSEKKMQIATLNRTHSIGCFCGDGISFPEKFIFNLFRMLGVSRYFRQATARILPWCKQYRYDGVVLCEKDIIIIEIHGLQHYKKTGFERFSRQTLLDIRKNDTQKKALALEHGIKPEHYIELDCRESTLSYLKHSIINSPLLSTLAINEVNVDWDDLFVRSLSSVNRKIIAYAKQHLNESTRLIAMQFGVSQAHVTRVLGSCGIHGIQEQKRRKDKRFHINNRNQLLSKIEAIIRCAPQITVSQLAGQLGRTPAGIYQILRNHETGVDMEQLHRNGKKVRIEGLRMRIGKPVWVTAPDGREYRYDTLTSACQQLGDIYQMKLAVSSASVSMNRERSYKGFHFRYINPDSK